MKRKIATVYLTVGLPGSGKTTWARNLTRKKPGTVIVCRDELRTMLLGRYAIIPRCEHLVTELTLSMVNLAVGLGHNVIIDETNLTAGRRREWLRNLKNIRRRTRRNIRIVFVWFTEMKRNLGNRMKDPRGLSRRKWASVIAFMKKKFEEPRPSEGCDKILKISHFRVSHG
jgi:predicted kinase